MLRKRLQQKIEDATFDCIDDIAEEIGLDVPFYPEVYWIGRDLCFEDLALDMKHSEDFKFIKKCRGSIYFYEPRIILIGEHNLEHISEEATHFLHLTNSKLGEKIKNGTTQTDLKILIEMLGFFGSKLITPDRKNYEKGFPDLIAQRKEAIKKFKQVYGKNVDIDYMTTYQQGYGLGEKLFNAYVAGLVPKEEVRSLFLNKLSGENEALLTFMNLKYAHPILGQF